MPRPPHRERAARTGTNRALPTIFSSSAFGPPLVGLGRFRPDRGLCARNRSPSWPVDFINVSLPRYEGPGQDESLCVSFNRTVVLLYAIASSALANRSVFKAPPFPPL